MEIVFFMAFATLCALLFNWGSPRIQGMTWAQNARFSTYAGKTALTALSFFLVLLMAGLIMGLVTSKGTTPPTA